MLISNFKDAIKEKRKTLKAIRSEKIQQYPNAPLDDLEIDLPDEITMPVLDFLAVLINKRKAELQQNKKQKTTVQPDPIPVEKKKARA